MASVHTITVGYNPNFSKAEVGKRLREAVARLRARPDIIEVEVLRLAPRIDRDELAELIPCYQSTDLTLRVQDDADGNPVVTQSASGGGVSRDIKEECRRAFCRLVLDAMHREQMSINVTVS